MSALDDLLKGKKVEPKSKTVSNKSNLDLLLEKPKQEPTPTAPTTPNFSLSNLGNYQAPPQVKTANSTPSIIRNPVLQAPLTKEATTDKKSPLISKLRFKGKSELEVRTEEFQQSLMKGLKDKNPIAQMMVTTGIKAEDLAREQVKADAKGKVYQLGQALQYALPTPGIVPGEGTIVSKAQSLLKDKELPKIEVVEPPKSPKTKLGEIKPTEPVLTPQIKPQEAITEALPQKTGKVAPQAKTEATDPLIAEAKKYESAEEFVKAQENKSTTAGEYVGQHQAPTRDGYNAPAYDLTGEGNIYPSDIYTNPRASILYGEHGTPEYIAQSKKSLDIARSLKGKPNAEVMIYRAVPKNVKEIKAGDWVTFNRDYAVNHGESNLNGKYNIIEKKVKADEIFTDGNSINEFGYDPKPKTKSQLTDIWNKAQEVKALKVKTEVPKVEPVKVERTIGTPSVSKRIETQTVEKGLTEAFKDMPDYEKVSRGDQAIKVQEILDTDPDKAIRIALGKELPTNGALPESVLIAVKNNALETGNTNLLVRLATEEGGVARESSILGQRIKMLDEANPDDAFTNIKRVVNERRSALEQKTGKKMGQIIKEETTKIKSELDKVKPKKDVWLAFVDEIQC